MEKKFNNPKIVEKKIMTNNQESSMMYDEQNAAKVLLSIGFTIVISQNQKEVKTNNTEINLSSNSNQMTSKHDSNTTLTVLKPNQIDAIKRKKHDEKMETNNSKIISFIH